MKVNIPKKSDNIYALMRQLGYAPDRVQRLEPSFSRSVRGGRFPRFHIYISEEENKWVLKLHLDQKAPSYGEHTAHSGEYDGPVVEAEAERIKTML